MRRRRLRKYFLSKNFKRRVLRRRLRRRGRGNFSSRGGMRFM